MEVFSLGIVLFRLVFKQYPFSTDQTEAATQIRDPTYLDKFVVDKKKNTSNVSPSREFMNLIKGMLAFNQEDRLSLD